MSRLFSSASGSVVKLKVPTRCGLSPCARQIRWIMLRDSPVHLAISFLKIVDQKHTMVQGMRVGKRLGGWMQLRTVERGMCLVTHSASYRRGDDCTVP